MSRDASVADVLAGRARWCVVEAESSSVAALMPDGCVDAVICDPPYGVDIAAWDSDIPPQSYLDDHLRVSRGSVVWFGASPPRVLLAFSRYTPQPERTLIWSPSFSLSQSAASGVMYRWHPIWVWRMTNVKRGVIPLDVLRHRTEGHNEWNHACTKPLALMRALVSGFAPRGIVADFFAGSGTTGVAALAEGGSCILVERDPRHAETCRQRCEEAAASASVVRGQSRLF